MAEIPDNERWARVRALFEQAVELGEPERGRLLDGTCVGDAELRREVEELLAEDARAADGEDPLGVPASAVLAAELAPPSLVGVEVGGYSIERCIGAGGMGTVYAATQLEPRRPVALKTLNFGLHDPVARRRFEHESEIVARLRHPGIAQIYASGTLRVADREVPYFAMELIEEALPLDGFAESHGLSVVGLIELFLRVCDAVQHGHQRGFLHRDLKPSNVLVDADGRPRVIDFGIARAIDPDLAAPTLLTRAGQVLGTLEYMSPEQLAAADADADLDTRSDVYALGVMLFQLLTGRLPVDVRGQSLPTAIRTLAEAELPAPSAFGGARGLRLEPELDWIISRATERERVRRYGTVAELASDLRRFLSHEPVSVGPPSTVYRVRKFARRHRLMVGAAGAVLLALLTGTIATSIGMVRAQRAERLAEDRLRDVRAEADRLNTINAFLRDLVSYADPKEGGREARVVDLLARASDSVETAWSYQPDLAAVLQTTIGRTYLGLGLPADALPHFERAVELAKQRSAPTDPTMISALHNLGLALTHLGRFEQALPALNDALTRSERRFGVEGLVTARTRTLVGSALLRAGESERAERELRAALAAFSAASESAPARDLIAVQTRLGDLLGESERTEEAVRLTRAAVKLAEERLPTDHPSTLLAYSGLAAALRLGGQLVEATTIMERVLRIETELYGLDNERTLNSRNTLAAVLKTRGELARAAETFAEIVETCRAAGRDDLFVISAEINLATTLVAADAAERARPVFERLLGRAGSKLPKGHWLLTAIRKGYGVCMTACGEFDLAESSLRTSLREFEAKLGPRHRRTRATLEALVELYVAWDRPDLAQPYRDRLQQAESR